MKATFSSYIQTSSLANPHERLYTLPLGLPEYTLGYEAAQWAHDWLIQPNGPRAGLPFRLTRDQFRFLLWWYALDEDGKWLYLHGVRRLAKGSGKSPFAAVLTLIEFCAPVRLLRFDPDAPGGVRGKPVEIPWIQIVATAESQTKNTMRMVRAFAKKTSKLAKHYELDVGKHQIYRLDGGEIEVVTSSYTSAEGSETSLVVADETEHWTPGNSGPELMATHVDNLTKSDSRLLETANAWIPDIETVAQSTWDAWIAQEEGRSRAEAKILYDARIAPPTTDLSDPGQLLHALEWVYDDCEWKKPKPGAPANVHSMIQRIYTTSSKVEDSKRKYLNWPEAPADQWITWKELQPLIDKTKVVEPGEDIVAFFDGSKSRDATAFIACRISDGHVFVPHLSGRYTIWEPDPAHDVEDQVDVDDIDLAYRELIETYNVRGVFADVQEWESFVKVTWPELLPNPKRTLWAVPSGKHATPIAWDMRGNKKDFTLAAELVNQEILDRTFTYDGHPLLTRHLLNLRRRPNAHGIGVGKESRSSPRKVDAGICFIGARMVRQQFINSKLHRKSGTGNKGGKVVVLG